MTDKPTDQSKPAFQGISRFRDPEAPSEDAKARPGLEGIFWSNTGPIVHKWHHYLPIYERYFSAFRGRAPKFLEIGVASGGSLHMWRSYFGAEATIFGIDIDPHCAILEGEHASIRIGSQDDPAFLRQVVEEMGGLDIVLDDGSHQSRHIRASLRHLFPLLSEGGIYMIEDLHATYWPSHHGGYQDDDTFINDIRQMYDDMHHWYHDQGQKYEATRGHLGAIHLYDSIAVLEKRRAPEPRHSRVGGTPAS